MSKYNKAGAAANLYKKNAINTASPAKLTLMLYDGAVRFSNMAIEGIEEKNIQKAHDNLMKAQNIILELRAGLDMKYPIAEEFDKVYDYIYRRLVEANMKKDKEIVEDTLRHIKTMRDTWKEVMKINKVN